MSTPLFDRLSQKAESYYETDPDPDLRALDPVKISLKVDDGTGETVNFITETNEAPKQGTAQAYAEVFEGAFEATMKRTEKAQKNARYQDSAAAGRKMAGKAASYAIQSFLVERAQQQT